MRERLLQDVEQLIPSLRRYARFLMRDSDAADDLVQDCLERAVRHLERFEQGTNLRAWLLTIMRNRFFDHQRTQRRGSEVALDALPSDMACSPPRQEHSLLMRELGLAFMALPDSQKLAMICVIFEGLPYDAAADVLGVSAGTVKSRVARGREALRRATSAEPLQRSA